jgi:hypothetical protein
LQQQIEAQIKNTKHNVLVDNLHESTGEEDALVFSGEHSSHSSRLHCKDKLMLQQQIVHIEREIEAAQHAPSEDQVTSLDK